LQVHVKLYGVLRTAAKTGRLELDFEDPISIRQLVRKLISVIARPEFETYLIDADTRDPRPNTLILVSGTEIGALNGIDGMLKDDDEVVFLPVVHGGRMPVTRPVSGSGNSHTLYEPRQG
jgi:molybdopterin converting factor small subunit